MSYPRNQSIFLQDHQSPKCLADRLRVTLDELNELLRSNGQLQEMDRQENWSARSRNPSRKLDKVHKRVALLLAKIETPDYLHSAIEGEILHSPTQAGILWMRAV